MKTIIKLFLIVLVLTSCEKTQTLKQTNLVLGGCNLEKQSVLKSYGPEEVKYTITDNKLDMFVGINETCCGEYSSSTSIKKDVITVNIITTKTGLCNCDCYYTFDFIFENFTKMYNYNVYLDNKLIFSGQIQH
jgi:hypothetical protein